MFPPVFVELLIGLTGEGALLYNIHTYTVYNNTHRMFPPVFVELLFGLTGEGALWAGVGPLTTVVHYMLFQL